jgi:hypothetical protein
LWLPPLLLLPAVPSPPPPMVVAHCCLAAVGVCWIIELGSACVSCLKQSSTTLDPTEIGRLTQPRKPEPRSSTNQARRRLTPCLRCGWKMLPAACRSVGRLTRSTGAAIDDGGDDEPRAAFRSFSIFALLCGVSCCDGLDQLRCQEPKHQHSPHETKREQELQQARTKRRVVGAGGGTSRASPRPSAFFFFDRWKNTRTARRAAGRWAVGLKRATAPGAALQQIEGGVIQGRREVGWYGMLLGGVGHQPSAKPSSCLSSSSASFCF